MILDQSLYDELDENSKKQTEMVDSPEAIKAYNEKIRKIIEYFDTGIETVDFD